MLGFFFLEGGGGGFVQKPKRLRKEPTSVARTVLLFLVPRGQH